MTTPEYVNPVNVLAAIRTVLEQPRPLDDSDIGIAVDGADCGLCEAERRRPFVCWWCEFHGTPIVVGCTCAEEWQRAFDYATQVLAKMDQQGISGSQLWGGIHTRPSILEELHDAQRRGKPTKPCGGITDDNQEDGCLHGARKCPVCGGFTSDDPENRPGADPRVDPWELIHQIRAQVGQWPRAVRPKNYDPNNRAHVACYAAEDAIQLLRIAEAEVFRTVTDLQTAAWTERGTTAG